MTKSNHNSKPEIVADGVIKLKGKHYGLVKDRGWYDLGPLGKKVRSNSDLDIILSNCYVKTTVQNLQERLEQEGWQGPTVGKVTILDDELYVKYRENWYHLILRPEEHRRLKETDDFYYCKLDGEIVPDHDNLYLALLNLYEIYKHTKIEVINAGREAAKKAIGRGALLWAADGEIERLADPMRRYDPKT